MLTFLFPGQGSQSRGMGGALFDAFNELTQKADKILGYSIKELCLEDPRKELNKTQFTQPALYVVNALSYYKEIQDKGIKPDYLIGHSLGEFNALLAAECFDFETGLKMVVKRGELMQQEKGGAMAAILNADQKKIVAVLDKNDLSGIDLANFNTPSQIVISGLKKDIDKSQAFLEKENALFYPLNTSGAFHSRYMEESKNQFRDYLDKCTVSETKIPVVSNVTGLPYANEGLSDCLASQITSAVKWCDGIQYLMSLGEMRFQEVGHGDVLTKLVAKIQQETSETVLASIQKNSKLKAKHTVATAKKTPVRKSDENTASPARGGVTALEKVAAWNQSQPIGTMVKSKVVEDESLKTRTEAVMLFGHRAAVYLEGYKGYFDLDEIVAV